MEKIEDTIVREVSHTSQKFSLKSFFQDKKKVFWGAVIIFLILMLGGCLSILLTADGSTIAGTINYTALKPDPGDRGQVSVMYKKYGTNDTYKTVYASALAEHAPWIWKDAVSGQPYEMVAQLVVDGKVVTTSEPLTVTAPAKSQQLDLHVTWHDLPESVVKEQTTSIKGVVHVNGYIPTGSTLAIQAKASADPAFVTVVTLPNPNASNNWSWNNTTPLKDYRVRALLLQGTNIIASSEIESAAGGDTAIDLVINSQAVPSGKAPVVPQPTQSSVVPTTVQPTSTSISGTVYVNGPENNNTSLLMLWRYPGQQSYQVITRIQNPSHNGQPWSWNGVVVGKQYEITGVLQVNQQNTASTQSQIITAPAQGINFTLNTGVFIPTPTGSVNVVSCNGIGNNQYNAILSFPTQQNANNYWLQVGNGAGSSNVYNSKVQSSSGPQITVQVNGNTSYYAQYAYALCSNCSEDQNFSNFSNANTFSCGGGPAYTGYYCNTGNYTCQLTTNNNPPYPYTNAGLVSCQQNCHPAPTATPTPTSVPPTPTPTPKIAYCNGSCGGNGYTCDNGLTCVDQGVIGGSVCRNPSCTDQEDCNCLPQ